MKKIYLKKLRNQVSTDSGLDVLTKDPFGKEKFGEGDIRILCQLVKK